jgi:hypothetical protein
MIIPTKHTNFSESLLGFGSYILTLLESPESIDSLWNQYQKDFNKKLYYAKHSFDNLLLTIVFLHSIGAVKEQEGVVIKCYC